tara:strand:+ start:67405 stop:67524 length:120 start_codon:yes stop_codon:yes gene_type:complete
MIDKLATKPKVIKTKKLPSILLPIKGINEKATLNVNVLL